jgi:hypothetical protein
VEICRDGLVRLRYLGPNGMVLIDRRGNLLMVRIALAVSSAVWRLFDLTGDFRPQRQNQDRRRRGVSGLDGGIEREHKKSGEEIAVLAISESTDAVVSDLE